MFIDELKSSVPNDCDRIAATCDYYHKSIINQIHKLAREYARGGENRIVGYLTRNSITPANKEYLGRDLGYDSDPINYNVVFSDLKCTGFCSKDPLHLSKDEFDARVIWRVKEDLIRDGFKNFTVRCDSAQNWNLSVKSGFFKDRMERVYTGTVGLYVFVDITW